VACAAKRDGTASGLVTLPAAVETAVDPGKVAARCDDGVAAGREIAQFDTVFRLRQQAALLGVDFMIAVRLALGADEIERHFHFSFLLISAPRLEFPDTVFSGRNLPDTPQATAGREQFLI
jgi:hypothetical protein